jgi:hypothetical protein
LSPDIVIPESSINSSEGGPVTIDEVELGVVSIPSVKLKDFKGSFTYASSIAKDVDISIQLSISSSFNGVVFVPWPICCVGVCGTLDVASFTETNNLGDVDMLAGSFDMNIPQVDFGPFSMQADPIGETSVATIKVKGIEMCRTKVTMPNPLGLTFGDSFPVENPMGPMNVSIKKTTMKELDSITIATPPATVKDIEAQNIIMPTVTTGPVTVSSITPISVSMSMPLWGGGVTTTGNACCQEITTSVTLNIESVTLKINGGIEFSGLVGSVTTASASSGAFDLDLKLLRLKICGLTLKGMKMPEMEVHF